MNLTLGGGAEFDLIRLLYEVWGDLAVGGGSDAAAIALPPGQQLVASTDAAVEGVHFRRDWLTPREIGYRSTAAALSDIAAAGSRARAVLLSLVLPERWRPELAELAAGVGEAVRSADAVIAGGDLSRGEALMISVTVLGSASQPISRAGGRAGDAIWLTGDVGRCAAALEALSTGGSLLPQVRARFARPEPRLAAGLWLARNGAHAQVDISDGLAADAAHLAAASGVQLRIDAGRIPREAGITLGHALSSGEEYELLVLAPSDLAAARFRAEVGLPLTRIGEVREGSGVELYSGPELIAPPAGYDHFSG